MKVSKKNITIVKFVDKKNKLYYDIFFTKEIPQFWVVTKDNILIDMSSKFSLRDTKLNNKLNDPLILEYED